MQDFAELKNNSSNKNIAIIWYAVLLLCIFTFSLFPKTEVSNPWDNSIRVIDSATRLGDENAKNKLINKSGMELVRLLKKYPYHSKLNMYVGYYYFMMGNMDSVIFHERKALENIYYSKMSQNSNEARDLLANASINKGMSLLAKGDSAEAFRLYASTAMLTPNHKIINMNLAEFYLAKKKPDAALFHYYSVLKNNKADLEAMLGIANCYYRKNRIDSVMHYTRIILKKYPDNAEAAVLSNLIK